MTGHWYIVSGGTGVVRDRVYASPAGPNQTQCQYGPSLSCNTSPRDIGGTATPPHRGHTRSYASTPVISRYEVVTRVLYLIVTCPQCCHGQSWIQQHASRHQEGQGVRRPVQATSISSTQPRISVKEHLGLRLLPET